MEATKEKCPKCNSTSVDDLASGEFLRRFQCKNVDCLHQWNSPRTGPAPALPAEETRGAVEENAMAKNKEKCDGCGEMVSVHPPARARHLKKCGRGATPRVPAQATRRPYKRRPTAPATEPGSELARSLADLKASRENLVKALVDGNPDVLAFDKAIAALEERPT